MSKLKYWYYRNIRYRRSKYKLELIKEFFKPGDIISTPTRTKENCSLCIGKGYYVPLKE